MPIPAMELQLMQKWAFFHSLVPKIRNATHTICRHYHLSIFRSIFMERNIIARSNTALTVIEISDEIFQKVSSAVKANGKGNRNTAIIYCTNWPLEKEPSHFSGGMKSFGTCLQSYG